MASILSFFARMDIRATLNQTVERFPLAAILVLVSTGFWMYQVNGDTELEWIQKGIVTTIVLFFFSTGLSILTESQTPSRYRTLMNWGIPLLFGILFFLSLDGLYDMDEAMVTYIILTLSGFVAMMFVSPYLIGYMRKWTENTFHFYNYFTLMAWTFLMSFVVGGALLVLGFIAISSVLALFEISSWVDEGKLFGNWAVIALSLVAPLYGLIHIADRSEYEKGSFLTNRFFSFLVRYVGTPFIYVYFFILYAYSIKVLANFSDWPKGIISWMVIGFSSFGYLIYVFSRAYEPESRMIAIFRKYFSFFVIPQIGMLFYAIALRIGQYDLTMNRYFVVVFGIWLALISGYYILSRAKNLSAIPASLVAIILIISVGPWSVYHLPLERQYDRLVQNLETAKILVGGTITPLASPKDITRELSNDIYSGIEYVCGFDSCSRIETLFPTEYATAKVKSETEWKKWNTDTMNTYRGPSKWEVVSAIAEKIKVQSSYGYDENATSPYILYNTFAKNGSPYPLTIPLGYTTLVNVSGSGNTSEKVYPFIELDPDTEKLRYYRAMSDFIEMSYEVPTILEGRSTPSGLDQSDLTFTLTGDSIDITLYLQSFAVKNPEYSGMMGEGEKWYYSISGIGLVKEKK
jgi:hypothetical protein